MQSRITNIRFSSLLLFHIQSHIKVATQLKPGDTWVNPWLWGTRVQQAGCWETGHLLLQVQSCTPAQGTGRLRGAAQEEASL